MTPAARANGDWFHVAAVRDVDNGQLKIYINEVLAAPTAGTLTGPKVDTTLEYDITMSVTEAEFIQPYHNDEIYAWPPSARQQFSINQNLNYKRVPHFDPKGKVCADTHIAIKNRS